MKEMVEAQERRYPVPPTNGKGQFVRLVQERVWDAELGEERVDTYPEFLGPYLDGEDLEELAAGLEVTASQTPWVDWRIRYVWKAKGGYSKGRANRGKVQVCTGFLKHLLPEVDFIVTVHADHLAGATRYQVAATLYHLLLQCERDENGGAMVLAPEVEAFIVEGLDFGAWHGNLARLVAQTEVPDPELTVLPSGVEAAVGRFHDALDAVVPGEGELQVEANVRCKICPHPEADHSQVVCLVCQADNRPDAYHSYQQVASVSVSRSETAAALGLDAGGDE